MQRIGALLLVVAAAACQPDDELGSAGAPSVAPLDTPAHERCAWIGQDTYEKGVATYIANADFFTAIHPKWYELSVDGTIRAFANAGDARVRAAAAAHGTLLMPMIADRKVDALRLMLGDAAARSAHVGQLVALVIDGGYDGLDIDYEHLWKATDRPGYQAFLDELATRMHAAGKQLSVAVPGLVAPKAAAAYDYAFLARTVDAVHIMGYDFHTVGTHSGPVAPLGWVEAVVSYAASIDPDRFVLALPNYGVTPTWYADSQASALACTTVRKATTTHMDTCVYGNYAPGRAPSCTRANGETIFFDDLGSLMQKVEVARRHGLAGVSYWTVGGEPRGFFAMVRSYF